LHSFGGRDYARIVCSHQRQDDLDLLPGPKVILIPTGRRPPS
jgi:hypothetical protein